MCGKNMSEGGRKLDKINFVRLTFSGFPEFTPIYLTWFNPKTGEVISNTSFSEGSTQVTAPPFTRDIVAVLKPE
jgi:hypothetical protein